MFIVAYFVLYFVIVDAVGYVLPHSIIYIVSSVYFVKFCKKLHLLLWQHPEILQG